MNNLLKIICKENKDRHHESHIRHHTKHPNRVEKRAAKERRLDCEKIKVQTWMPEI